MCDSHYIRRVNGHYELRDVTGRFICSGDTEEEVYADLIEMLTNYYKNQYVK